MTEQGKSHFSSQMAFVARRTDKQRPKIFRESGGEPLDRGGTPYFFHNISRDIMDISSAGPDHSSYPRRHQARPRGFSRCRPPASTRSRTGGITPVGRGCHPRSRSRRTSGKHGRAKDAGPNIWQVWLHCAAVVGRIANPPSPVVTTPIGPAGGKAFRPTSLPSFSLILIVSRDSSALRLALRRGIGSSGDWTTRHESHSSICGSTRGGDRRCHDRGRRDS